MTTRQLGFTCLASLAISTACGAPEPLPTPPRVEPAKPSVVELEGTPEDPEVAPAERRDLDDETSERAIAAFRRAWDQLVPTLAGWERENADYISRLMPDQPDHFHVVSMTCEDAASSRRRFESSFTLQGRIEALDRPGACLEVSFSGGMKAEVVGYLDPQSLELLHLWRVPEG